MSDWIKEVTLVDGNGKLLVLDSGDDLLAAQTSLGVLGVVVEYLVEVQEMSVCRVQNRFDTKLSVSGKTHFNFFIYSSNFML